MTGRIILFAGPSLPDGATIPAAIDLRPPARCGDLLRTVVEGPRAVALVDGVFEHAPTVWHKEILYLMEWGIPVCGAASLGALRAAELDRYGMIGIGAIYRAYRDGVIERDDAVMVSHAPPELGHRALTVALVDAEASIMASGLDPADTGRLLRAARRLNFRERTWPRMIAEAGCGPGTAATIDRHRFSRKALDTAELIDWLLDTHPLPLPPAIPTPRTTFLRRLIRGVGEGLPAAPDIQPSDVQPGGTQAACQQGDRVGIL